MSSLAILQEKQSASAERDGFIYIAKSEDGNIFKIGFSSAPLIRVKALRYNKRPMRLVGVIRGTMHFELQLHDRFSSHAISGREWFKQCVEIDEFISSCVFLDDSELDKTVNINIALPIKLHSACMFAAIDERTSLREFIIRSLSEKIL